MTANETDSLHLEVKRAFMNQSVDAIRYRSWDVNKDHILLLGLKRCLCNKVAYNHLRNYYFLFLILPTRNTPIFLILLLRLILRTGDHEQLLKIMLASYFEYS